MTTTAPAHAPSPARRLARLVTATGVENTLFLVGLALVALHVVDDNFLQPNPGTSAGDHLISGLVPLAALSATGWAYPRLRAGARGALALFLFPLAVVAGIEAVRALSGSGLSGDDYTGLLAMTAGPLFLGLGAVTLWRSRRTDDRLWRRYPRRALLALAGLLTFMTVGFGLLIGYGASHIARDEPLKDLGVAHERVTLTTSDDLKLAALYVPSRNGAAVIAFPGRNGPQRHARMLARHGYGVLLLDRRGEGDSEGDPNGFGWGFEKDIKAGIAFLQQRPDVERGRIGGLGLSVGGEMMLQTAAETKDLAAVVSEGAGARVVSEELDDVSGFAKVLSAPLYATKTASLAVFSNTAPPADLTELIPRIAPRPIFLIHAAEGEVDDKTPEYLAAAKGPATSWKVPKGAHTDGIKVLPEEYERRVVGFFDAALR